MFTRPGPIAYNPPGAPPYTYTQAKWDIGIQSLTDLAAVSTIHLTPPVIRAWINADDGTEQVWRLLANTAATTDGIQRPNDYDDVTNAKVWFKASS